MCSSAFFGLSFRLSQGKWAISFDMSYPKKCCYSVGTEAQIWATTFMPQQRTETKVWDRLLNCEKAESWVQVCYWGWEFFWVRCYLWRWKHLPGSTPRLKPSPTPVDSQRGLCTAALQDPGTGSGGLEQDARSYRLFSHRTGPPSVKSLRDFHISLRSYWFWHPLPALTQSRGPTSSLGPGTHTPEPHPPCRAAVSLETRRTWVFSRPVLPFVDKEMAWGKTASSPKATHLARSENWCLTQPSPPLLHPLRRERCTRFHAPRKQVSSSSQFTLAPGLRHELVSQTNATERDVILKTDR